MKLTHMVVAGAALVSFSAIAADEAKNSSPQKEQSASGGATQQQGAKSGQQMSQNQEMVKQAQQKLSEAGHDVGAADGILGPKTQKGLKEFQQSKGLQPSGQLDQKTMAALGVSGDASASTGASSGRSADKTQEPSGSASGGATGSGGASQGQGASEKSK